MGIDDRCPQRFTGQAPDQETGLDYFNARYYAAALGRFTSADPGNAGANLFDPQTWNAYAYVRGNPLAFLDPTGMQIVKLDNGSVGDDGTPPFCGTADTTPDQVNVSSQPPPDISIVNLGVSTLGGLLAIYSNWKVLRASLRKRTT